MYLHTHVNTLSKYIMCTYAFIYMYLSNMKEYIYIYLHTSKIEIHIYIYLCIYICIRIY